MTGSLRQHEVDRLADGLDALGLILGHADAVAVLELHDQFDEVERVGFEVLLEPARLLDRGCVDTKLLREVRSGSAPTPLRASGPSGRGATLSAGTDAESGSGAPCRTGYAGGLQRSAGASRDLLLHARARQARSRSRSRAGWRSRGKRSPGHAGRAGRRRRRTPGRGARAARRAGDLISRPPSFGRGARRGSRRGSRRPRYGVVPSISFSATLPVKPSVTTTSASPGTSPSPSTLPANSNGGLPERGQARVRLGDDRACPSRAPRPRSGARPAGASRPSRRS